MFSRIIVKSFVKNIRRKVLAVSIIMVGIALISSLLNIWADIEGKVAGELRVYGSNITVKPKARMSNASELGFDPLKSQGFINVDDLSGLKTIFWRNNIVGFAPFIEKEASVSSSGNVNMSATVTGTWFDNQLDLPTSENFSTGVKKIKPWWKVQGNWPGDTKSARTFEVLAGREIADRLNIKPGDEITVKFDGKRETQAIVTGILDADRNEESRIYAPIEVVQLASRVPGKAGWAEVSALTTPDNELAKKYESRPTSLSSKEFETWYCTAFIKSIAYQVEEVVKGSDATPIRQISDSEGAILNKIKYLMIVFMIMSFVISIIAIWGLMSGYVQERSSEVGLSKALGADNMSIVAVFLAEAVIIGLIGGLLGVVLGHFASLTIGAKVFGRPIALNETSFFVSMGVAAAVSLLGNLSTVIAVARLNTKDVIHAR